MKLIQFLMVNLMLIGILINSEINFYSLFIMEKILATGQRLLKKTKRKLVSIILNADLERDELKFQLRQMKQAYESAQSRLRELARRLNDEASTTEITPQ